MTTHQSTLLGAETVIANPGQMLGILFLIAFLLLLLVVLIFGSAMLMRWGRRSTQIPSRQPARTDVTDIWSMHVVPVLDPTQNPAPDSAADESSRGASPGPDQGPDGGDAGGFDAGGPDGGGGGGSDAGGGFGGDRGGGGG